MLKRWWVTFESMRRGSCFSRAYTAAERCPSCSGIIAVMDDMATTSFADEAMRLLHLNPVFVIHRMSNFWSQFENEAKRVAALCHRRARKHLLTLRKMIAQAKESKRLFFAAAVPISVCVAEEAPAVVQGSDLRLIEVTQNSSLQIQFALQHCANCFFQTAAEELHLDNVQFEAGAQREFIGYLLCLSPLQLGEMGQLNNNLECLSVVGGCLFLPRREHHCLMWLWFHPLLRGHNQLAPLLAHLEGRFGRPLHFEAPLSRAMKKRLETLNVQFELCVDQNQQEPTPVFTEVHIEHAEQNIVIRTATPDDLEHLQQANLVKVQDVETQRLILERAVPELPLLLVALRGEEIVGQVSVDLSNTVAKRPEVANIDHLRVVENARGGVGSLLLDAAEELARRNGKTICEIGVVGRNVRPLRLYVRKGYHQSPVGVAAQTIFLGGVTITRYSPSALVVQKNLADVPAENGEQKSPEQIFDELMYFINHPARYATADQYARDDFEEAN
jgi:GNAT superfamily N-acetyltransferase